ncbi:hypothetical protein [Comamonas serinivorans]|uniref:hypothetical protein n=1 Tax=Comamonas serinivorans TaxID=1082851 RepID=UPI0012FC897B|nr:hypothetical protein [Comamonas serinivorans]
MADLIDVSWIGSMARRAAHRRCRGLSARHGVRVGVQGNLRRKRRIHRSITPFLINQQRV